MRRLKMSKFSLSENAANYESTQVLWKKYMGFLIATYCKVGIQFLI